MAALLLVAISHLIHTQHEGKINSDVISMTFLDIESNREDTLMKIFFCHFIKGLGLQERVKYLVES